MPDPSLPVFFFGNINFGIVESPLHEIIEGQGRPFTRHLMYDWMVSSSAWRWHKGRWLRYRVKLKRVLQGESCSWIRLSAYALLGWVIASIGLQLYFNPSSRSWLDPQYWTALKKVGESMRLAEANYYDSNKSSFEKLSKLAISGMTQSLDRHSAYYDSSEFHHFEENMHMRYAGIGIKIRSGEQGILITRVFKNSPAKEVGLLAGDHILEADNHLLTGKNIDEAGEIIRGEPDTLVSLKIRDWRQNRLCTVSERKLLSSVDNWWVDENKTAYLKFPGWRTQIEVEEALHDSGTEQVPDS